MNDFGRSQNDYRPGDLLYDAGHHRGSSTFVNFVVAYTQGPIERGWMLAAAASQNGVVEYQWGARGDLRVVRP